MVDDAEERNELSFGGPAGFGIVEACQLVQHSTPQVTEPLEEQLLLVLAAPREPDVTVSHGVTVSPKIAGRLTRRVSRNVGSLTIFCVQSRHRRQSGWASLPITCSGGSGSKSCSELPAAQFCGVSEAAHRSG